MIDVKRYIGDLSIRSKLLIGYVTTFVLLLAISGLIIHPIMQNAIEANIESELNNTTKTILSMVRTSADASIKNYLRAVAEKNRDIVQQSFDLYRQGVLSEQDAKARAVSILSAQHIGTTGYIYCLDSTGVIQAHPVAALVGSDLSRYDFIRKQLIKREGYLEYDWQNPGELTSRPKALYMTHFKPWDWIISASSYREEFIQLINIDNFRDSIQSIRFGKTGYPYILDSRGDVIVHPVLTGNMYDVTDSKGNRFIREMIEKKNGKIVYTWRNPGEKEFREKLVIFNHIPEFDWIVVSSSYVDEFYEPLTHIQRIIVVLFITSVIFLLFLTYIFSSYIVKGLNTLIRSFQIVGMGDLTARMSKRSDDEFGRIADYFNVFMEKLEANTRSLQQEIAERTRIEEALRDSEKRLSQIIDFLPDATFAIDLEGKVIVWNRAAEKYTGVKAEDILGKDNYEHSIPYYGIRRPILIDLVLKPSGEIEKQYPYLKRDGRMLIGEGYTRSVKGGEAYMFGIAAPLCDSDGNVIGAIESIRDITERKLAEKALAESEEKYRSLVDSINLGVFRSSPEPGGCFLQANPAMLRIFGYDSPDDFSRISVSELYQNPGERVCVVEEVTRNGFIRDKEIAMRKRDGTPIWISLNARARYDDTGEILWITGVNEDITERKTLEEQLRQVQKMDAIGTLAGGVAHDFNNILTAIIGYGSLLRLRMSEENHLRGYAEDILSAAKRAANLTQSLLAFSRKQIMNPNPVNLNEIIERFEKFLRRVIGEDIEFRIHLSNEDLIVMADAGQIEQVLMNLATNARDSMPDGGALIIETGRVDITTPNTYMKPGAYAAIAVSDTGKGMDETTRLRIFEPFYTTKETGKGTGLGLSIVYGIIKQHGGEIDVTSEPEIGTTIRIYLKLIDTKIEGMKGSAPAAMVGGCETILLAEDDPVVRRLSKVILEEHGYAVIEATDGEDAVARFMENRDSIQLLLLDVVMPKKNGREAYEEIHRVKEHVPVLFTSGYTADIIMKKGGLEKERNFIAKPVTPSALLTKIREILDT